MAHLTSMKTLSLIQRAAEEQGRLFLNVLKNQLSLASHHFCQACRCSEAHLRFPQTPQNYLLHYKYALHRFSRLHRKKIYKSFWSRMSTVPPAPEPESHETLLNKKDGCGKENITNNHRGERQTNNYVIHVADEDTVSYDGHIPVLVKETINALSLKENQVIVDMTFGAGGHARHIMKSTPTLTYIAADRDPIAFQKAGEFSSDFRAGQVIPLLSKFSELWLQLIKLNIPPGSVDAFFMDLGASSMQFDTADRGFSLSRDGPLDMRMDRKRFPGAPTAADVVNTLDPGDLSQIIKKYGEESHATEIAHAIVEARYAFGKFTRTEQLANVIKTVFESSFRHDKLHRHAHVATKTFQALRIFVNDELNEIHNGIEIARHFLKPGGRCVAISFHSLEDRIVKRHFHDINMDEKPNLPGRYHLRNPIISHDVEDIKETFLSGPWQVLSRKVIEASNEEIDKNPRARSAKLRAAVKT